MFMESDTSHIKLSILSEVTYKFKAAHIKIPKYLLEELDSLILKFIYKEFCLS